MPEGNSRPQDEPKTRGIYSVLRNIAAAVIGSSTVVLAVATVLLWNATNDLVRESEVSAVRRDRAYVTIDEIKKVTLTAGERVPTALYIQNHGQTPATDVVIDAMGVVTARADYEEWPNPLRDSSASMVLGPHQEKYNGLVLSLTVTAEEIEAMRRGEREIAVFLSVRYRDIFGVQQHTAYKVRYWDPDEHWGIVAADMT